MLLTITYEQPPATDLGYLLHKNPARAQSFELPFGKAQVFYPSAEDGICTAALLLDIDPVGLVRDRRGPSPEGQALTQYVNDRPYVASSFMSVAIGRVFSTAMSGRSQSHQHLADSLLPLKPKVLHILLAIADGPRHGYSIMQEVLERTDGQVRLWPAGLYGLLRELEKSDWIVESDTRPAADEDDERRRYFALTPHGKRVLDAEVRRLEAIVHHARSSRALRKAARA